MEINVVSNMDQLNQLDTRILTVFEYISVIYKRITLKAVSNESVIFYNEIEQHMIELKEAGYAKISYAVLEKDNDNIYHFCSRML